MTTGVPLPQGVTVLERGWLSSNNVVFNTGVSAVVDTGYVTHAPQTVALVRSVLGPSQLHLVISTHLHSDHCGGNAALRGAFPSSRTLIPPGDADAVRRWDEAKLTYAATGQECARFSIDGLIQPGGVVILGELEWEIHAAPGHDPHSVILFERSSRTLISADALWEDGFGIVFPELNGEPGFSEVAETLDLIESLAPASVIPGHGSPYSGDAVSRSLVKARRRLAGQREHPERHAVHAMKVLIKFKLLDCQSVAMNDLLGWARKVPYMRQVHSRFGFAASFDEWLAALVDELQTRRAVRREGAMLYNI